MHTTYTHTKHIRQQPLDILYASMAGGPIYTYIYICTCMCICIYTYTYVYGDNILMKCKYTKHIRQQYLGILCALPAGGLICTCICTCICIHTYTYMYIIQYIYRIYMYIIQYIYRIYKQTMHDSIPSASVDTYIYIYIFIPAVGTKDNDEHYFPYGLAMISGPP